MRVTRHEKWRQIGDHNVRLLLQSLTDHLPSGEAVYVVRLHALPADWQRALLTLTQVPRRCLVDPATSKTLQP